MKKTMLLLLIFTHAAMAAPKRVEVWFLSIDKTSWLKSIIETKQKKLSLIAQTNLQCQQMGEYCFDPQVGLYKKGEEGKVKEELDLSKVERDSKYDFMDTPEGVERDMINCDGDSFFDIFCGKSKGKKTVQQAKLEVWVDVSSTMKQVDFKGFDKQCSREMFLRSLSGTCKLGQDMKVYFFEEFRKEAGTLDRLCLSAGLNNMKRIISDLKKSQADSVIIITDIFEAEEGFINAIEDLEGTIRGLKEPMYAKDLRSQLKRVTPWCK